MKNGRVKSSCIKKIYYLVAICLLWPLGLSSDFFTKIPEINPGDISPGYDLYQPPWYPYDVEEAEKYTVNESGDLIERSEEDSDLLNYGKKKTKIEEIVYHLRKLNNKLTFEKVVVSPKVIVLDFYGHANILLFGDMNIQLQTAYMVSSGKSIEYGGYPPIPGSSRILYDTWTLGALFGWKYDTNGTLSIKTWTGLLVPNLREMALFFTSEGVGTIKHANLILERDIKKNSFNPGLAVLRAISGQDFGWNLGKWQKEFVEPTWAQREKPSDEDYSNWDDAVASLVIRDITSKRVPEKRAFYRVRDVPELSEPIFLDLIENDKATLVMKRNLASLLRNYSAPRVAKALHKLARDEDAVTAIRAVDSLSDHPHGRVKQILIDWLTPEIDDMRRAKAILMMGRTLDTELSSLLIEFLPKAQDDMERELVLRSLMRIRYQGAKDLFKKYENSSFETLAYTSRLGQLVLGDLSEGQAMKLIDKAFRREDALPGSGMISSFSPMLRFDLVKWMAHTEMSKPRRRLWKYIRQFQDLGGGSESGGVAHVLSYGLYELEMGDDVIPKKEATKLLNIMVSRSETDVQIRMAALSRLYELDSSACLKASQKIINKFLKGKKISTASNGSFDISELDLLYSAINLVLIDNPDQELLIEKIMKNSNFSGRSKSLILENLFNVKKKLALSIIKKNLKYYVSRSDLSSEDERYVVRLLRFAGMFKDPDVLQDVVKLIEKSSDEWLRFVSLYSLRLALNSDEYANVVTGKARERADLTSKFRKALRKIKK